MSTAKTGVSSTAYWHAVLEQRGLLFLANGIDRPVCVPGPSDTARYWGIIAPTSAPTLTVTASASGAIYTTSGYTLKYYYAYFNSNSDVTSNPSPVSSGASASGQKILVKFSASVPDSQVTHKKLFRNTDQQADAFYQVAKVTASVNSYLDNTTDAVASAGDLMRTDNDPPGYTMPFVAWHNGLMHLYGSRVESDGTISITSGSVTVTGVGTHFASGHVGQTLVVSGQTSSYLVASYSSATSIELVSWAGGDVSGVNYKLFPASDRCKHSWSRAGTVENFPAANTNNIFENDSDEPTGLFMVASQLFAAKRRHVYAIVYQTDPLLDGKVFARLSNRGLVNQRCVIEVGGMAYLMDERGFYGFDGGITAQEIDQAISRLVNPSDEPTADRINWTYREKFHGFYDSKRHRLIWFVCLGTDTEPHHAFCYDILMQRWVIEEYQQGITASGRMEDETGRIREVVGDENGQIWAYGITRARDGAPPSASGTLSGTLTGVAGAVLTDSAASFYTTGNGLIGCPVYMVDGDAKGLFGVVQSNTGTALTLKSAMATAPGIGDSYKVGAVELELKTRWYSMMSPDTKKRITSLRIYFEKNAADLEILVTLYKDWETTPYVGWDSIRPSSDGFEMPSTATADGKLIAHLNSNRGYVEIPLGDDFANLVRFGFEFVGTDVKPRITGYEWRADYRRGTNTYGP